jgi:WD40 repeat protein
MSFFLQGNHFKKILKFYKKIINRFIHFVKSINLSLSFSLSLSLFLFLSRLLISFSDDGYLVLWDLRTHDKSPQRVLFSPGGFNCVDFNPKISHLFVSGHSRDSAQYDFLRSISTKIVKINFYFGVFLFNNYRLWDLRNAVSEKNDRRRRTKPFNFNTLDERNVSGAYWNKNGDRIGKSLISQSTNSLSNQNIVLFVCLIIISIFSLFCTEELSNDLRSLSKGPPLCLL